MSACSHDDGSQNPNRSRRMASAFSDAFGSGLMLPIRYCMNRLRSISMPLRMNRIVAARPSHSFSRSNGNLPVVGPDVLQLGGHRELVVAGIGNRDRVVDAALLRVEGERSKEGEKEESRACRTHDRNPS